MAKIIQHYEPFLISYHAHTTNKATLKLHTYWRNAIQEIQNMNLDTCLRDQSR